MAVFQVNVPQIFAFFVHIKPVRLSVTVLLPLSVKRGLGHATPFWYVPSSPARYDVV
jgi:hypothetical protein